MKIDQIAYYCASDEIADLLKYTLGLSSSDWTVDTVTGKSQIMGAGETDNVALLQFNYQLGIELEIIRYVTGLHWHRVFNPLYHNGAGMFLSHTGIHLDDGEDFPEVAPGLLRQETWTKQHTSPYLAGLGRKYHYRIYELAPSTYIKYIKRIHAKDQ